jgi:hypothetical protein
MKLGNRWRTGYTTIIKPKQADRIGFIPFGLSRDFTSKERFRR